MDEMIPENKHQARFLAHLAIILQNAGITSISVECVKNYAQLIANEVNPDENPREDAALVAAYCHLLDTDLGTEIYSTVVVNLSCMNHTNRIHLIDLAKQHGLNVSEITQRAAIELQQSEVTSNDLNALEILLSNQDLSTSLEIACQLVRNLIVMNRQDDAVSAIEKLKECGADDLSENDGYVAIRSHLEAMEIFNKWNKLSQSRENYNDSNTIDMSASFVRRVQLERENENRMSEKFKWARDMKNLANEMKEKVTTILKTNAKWFDEKAKSVCIPMLVISCLKILKGSDSNREMLDLVNVVMSEKYKLYTCLNTQTARNIMDFCVSASAGLVDSGSSV